MNSPSRQLVLLAEDEALVSFTLEEILMEARLDVLVVANAQEAIAALEKDYARFCALLTDIRMPGEATGWDVARRARQLRPLMPVIYMAGDNAEQWRAQGVPGSLMLQKSFAEAQLVTALATLLNEAGMAAISH